VQRKGIKNNINIHIPQKELLAISEKRTHFNFEVPVVSYQHSIAPQNANVPKQFIDV
jgi:hypothetical protein